MTFAVRPSGLMVPPEQPIVGGDREPPTGEYYKLIMPDAHYWQFESGFQELTIIWNDAQVGDIQYVDSTVVDYEHQGYVYHRGSIMAGYRVQGQMRFLFGIYRTKIA